MRAWALTLGGWGATTRTVIESEGQEVTGVVIRLQDTGQITGTVVSPVDGSPAASAQLRLFRVVHLPELFDAVTADADGRFSFDLLPLGDYFVRALDPRTGRLGRTP